MARRFANIENIRQSLITKMERDGTYSPKTLLHMASDCKIVSRYVSKSLYEIDSEDVRQIAQRMASEGLAVSTQKDYVFALKQMLRHIGNPAWSTRIVFQADTRPRVDWLTPEQAQAVLDSENVTPAQHLVIVLALCMGLRKVEISRLKTSDIHLNRQYITVTGKGRAGGKLRLVPFHARFLPALDNYLPQRGVMVCRAVFDAPDNLIVWFDRSTHTVRPYEAVKGSGMDCLIRRASQSIGVHFSAHTLRRTFGRMLWLSGVPVVTIAKILGHSSTEQTLEYIGANLDDMASAMDKLTLQ